MIEKKILIIEDDTITSLLLCRQLEMIGYPESQITVCSCLNEIYMLDPNDFEMVITDLTLPDSDTHMTFNKVHKYFPYHPVIVLSGTSELEIVELTLQQGAQDYLVKGDITDKVLSKSIKYSIERKKMLNDYRRLFEDNPAPMYIYERATFKFLAVNTAALNQYGYSREEFLLLNSLDLRPKDEIEKFKTANINVPADYYDFGRWKHLNKEGNIVHVHIYGHATVFEGKEAAIILAINNDKKVRSEIELEKKNNEINIILDSITDGFFAINANWEFTYVNKECERLFRHTKQQMVGKNIWTLFPEGKKLKFYTEYDRAMKENISVHFEEYDRLYDTWVSVNAYPSENGLAVYFTDITDKKKAQKEIFINEQNLRAIINNTQDIIWSMDTNHQVISANEAFWKRVYDITGKKERKLSATDFDENLFATWKQYFERAFAGEAYKIIWEEELNGKQAYEEVSFNPIHDVDNNVIGISCFSRDISEQQQHIKMIEKQNKQLKKIAWIQSHEVRAPLANILGLIKLLDHNDIKSEVLQGLEESANKLDEVIKKVTYCTVV